MLTKDIKELAENQLSKLLDISKTELLQLLSEHDLNEKRLSSITNCGLIFSIIQNLFEGKCSHKDTQWDYYERFGKLVTTNTFSDRLSQIPPDFLIDLIQKMQMDTEIFGSHPQSKQIKTFLSKVYVEDSSIFQANARLTEKIGKSTGKGENTALKLFLGLEVLNGEEVQVSVQKGGLHDSNHVFPATSQSLDLRDMAWCSYQDFFKRCQNGKYFISRLKENLNPRIVDCNQPELIDLKLKEVDWEKYNEDIKLEVLPLDRETKEPYFIEPEVPFTLHIVSSVKGNERYFYVYHLPTECEYTFETIHELYRLRWFIEEVFKEIKAILGTKQLRRYTCLTNVVNLLLLAVITWMILKKTCVKIVKAHNLNPDGLRLNEIIKSRALKALLDIIWNCFICSTIPIRKLKSKTKAWILLVYSKRRQKSEKKKSLNRAVTNLKRA